MPLLLVKYEALTYTWRTPGSHPLVYLLDNKPPDVYWDGEGTITQRHGDRERLWEVTFHLLLLLSTAFITAPEILGAASS